MLAFLSVWAGEAQLLAFSSMFVHVCHLSRGLIQIVLWLRDRRFACEYKEGDGPLCVQPPRHWCAEAAGVRTPCLSVWRLPCLPWQSQPERTV